MEVTVPCLDESAIQAMPDDTKRLVLAARALFVSKLSGGGLGSHGWIVSAPGRVNLIGEHTDYSGGFVLPLAVNYSTVCYGVGTVHTSKGTAATQVTLRVVSDAMGEAGVESRVLSSLDLRAPGAPEEGSSAWVRYVEGVVAQYVPDLPPQGCVVELAMAYSSSVPLGAGLSSSASLEVATALFLECVLQDMAYSSAASRDGRLVERAVRCQRAENLWAFSPCGIMDQMASSCCLEGHCMLLDCRSYAITHVPVKLNTDEDPVLVVCNSGVTHSIHADAEYGKRRRECSDAVQAIQAVPLYHVETLRDATVADLDLARDKGKLDDLLYRRALHVVTENRRVIECKTALKLGLWEKVGTLMNASQQSLQQNFEVSCEEIDFLCQVAWDLAVKVPTDDNNNDIGGGVYGSRMTGGGFGGCTVTLVQKKSAQNLIDTLQKQYMEKYGKTCPCFVTLPAGGARIIAIDTKSTSH